MNNKWLEVLGGGTLVVIGLAIRAFVEGQAGAVGVVPVLVGIAAIAIAVTRKR
ncbi:hypothetical protein KBI23_05765 [bacterium]|nr:hypothetical protein [bacterium]MBP9810448.1 hypothetical protein [bacterium]